MARPVYVTIKGADVAGVDAPAVDDLLGQIRDFVEVLRGVERAIDAKQSNELIWRVTNAKMNSPISVELTPFPVNPAVYVGERVDEVERAAMNGLMALARGEARPAYFTDEVLPKARQIHARVLNGLANTEFRFDQAISAEPIVVDRGSAQQVERVFISEKETAFPYRELGSVEGFISRAELDGHGRAVLRFKSRLDGTEIKAIAEGTAFRQLEALRLSDVWRGVRVRVYGTISYKKLGHIDGMHATGIEVLDQSKLPGIDDIVDPNFTNGLSTEEFLKEIRDV